MHLAMPDELLDRLKELHRRQHAEMSPDWFTAVEGAFPEGAVFLWVGLGHANYLTLAGQVVLPRRRTAPRDWWTAHGRSPTSSFGGHANWASLSWSSCSLARRPTNRPAPGVQGGGGTRRRTRATRKGPSACSARGWAGCHQGRQNQQGRHSSEGASRHSCFPATQPSRGAVCC